MPVPVLIVGTFFVLMGVSALARPEWMAAFVGTRAETAEFRNEVRAVYGGFGVCLGLAILLAERALGAHADGILLAGTIALFGMASGRVLSFLIERTGPWPVVFCAGELLGAALLYSAVG